MFPTVKENAEFKNTQKHLQKQAAQHTPQQAATATTSTIRHFAELASMLHNNRTWATIVACFITAARHDDLCKGTVTHHWYDNDQHLLIIRITFGIFKSDPTGGRHFTKTIELPLTTHNTQTPLTTNIINALINPSTYSDTYTTISRFGLTPHSMRVTAVTHLTTVGVHEATIILLTGHSTGVIEPRQVYRYTAPRPDSELARTQRRLSSMLLRWATNTTTTTTM